MRKTLRSSQILLTAASIALSAAARSSATAPTATGSPRTGSGSATASATRIVGASTAGAALQDVRRGGRVVNVGSVADRLPIDVKWLMDEQVQLIGANWLRSFPLTEVNTTISGLKDRDGGFSNYVVIP